MALPCVFGLVFLVPSAQEESRIGQRQQTTTGNITAHEPSNHDTCRFAFAVRGVQFNGADGCPIHSVNDPVIIGANVLVYFDPSNPAKSALEDFNEKARRNKGMISILLFGIGAVAAMILFSKARTYFKSV